MKRLAFLLLLALLLLLLPPIAFAWPYGDVGLNTPDGPGTQLDVGGDLTVRGNTIIFGDMDTGASVLPRPPDWPPEIYQELLDLIHDDYSPKLVVIWSDDWDEESEGWYSRPFRYVDLERLAEAGMNKGSIYDYDSNMRRVQNILAPMMMEGKTILDRTFIGCTSLSEVTIPSSVTNIGANAFYGCASLSDLTIPSSVTSIGQSAFRGCTSLSEVTIPGSVTDIGKSAFYGCTSLSDLTIPSNVTSIGLTAFYGCTSLSEVTFEGKTKAQVQNIPVSSSSTSKAYPWHLKSGTSISCTDGTLVVP